MVIIPSFRAASRWLLSLCCGSLLLLSRCSPSPQPKHTTGPAPPAAVDAGTIYAQRRGLAGPVSVAFTLPTANGSPRLGGFYSLPWPSELWRRADGELNLQNFPGNDSFLLDDAVADARSVFTAFAVNPTVYFHFSGPLSDMGTLPTARGSLSANAPVQLLDVDPHSPARGQRIPIQFRYYPRKMRFVAAHSLALKPVPGFVLRPDTLYAAVVLRKLTTPPLGTSTDFELSKWTIPHADPVKERARKLHEPAIAQLARDGITRAQLGALAVFRTQRPHAAFQAMFERATALRGPHAPRLLQAAWLDREVTASAPYYLIRGYYCTPNFQSDIDDVPFTEKGGTVRSDDQGRPQLQLIDEKSEFYVPECHGLLRARFALTIPKTPMPARGWPLLVVAHGTTGSALSFVESGDFAEWAAREGVAAVGTDQPLHGGDDPRGARPGSRRPYTVKIGPVPIRVPVKGKGSEMAFFHALRPAVMRDNLRQAAIDAVVLSRLIVATDFAAAARADGSLVLPSDPQRPSPRFDSHKLLLAGHSQGCNSIAVQGAIDPLVKGVILSGCGGDFRLGFTQRTDSNAIEILAKLTGLEKGELDAFHPLLALFQTVIDPVDPQSWASYYFQPRPGETPRSLLHFEGLGDTMSLPSMAEALAVALHAQPLKPVLHPVQGLQLLGIRPSPVVSGNQVDGRATIALVQLQPPPDRDGHYVMYDLPEAHHLVRLFLGALAHGDQPPRLQRQR